MSTTVHLFRAAASKALSSGRTADSGRRHIRVPRRCGGRSGQSARRRPSWSIAAFRDRRRNCRTPRSAGGRYVRLMPTGLPALSSTKLISGRRNRVGLPSRISKLGLDRRTHHLLGRNAVNPFGPRSHELDAAAGDDEGLEAVGAQIGEQFEHRLVDKLGVGAVEARMARGGEPIGDDLCGILRWSCRHESP